LQLGAISPASPGNGNVPEVVLIDFDADPPKQYRLSIGEIVDGIELVEADYSDKSVLVRRGEKEVELRIGE
tara:strand:+ start:7747 stop:7959 length:213 start_codon:yes stop_codon:yes gene_type:complete